MYPPLLKSMKITIPSTNNIKHVQNKTTKYTYPDVHATKVVPIMCSEK